MTTMNRCIECGREDRPFRRGWCVVCYEKARRAGIITSRLVDATPAKARIAELFNAGWGYRRVAKVAGIHRTQVAAIMKGQTTITIKTRDAILAVEVPEPDVKAIAHRELCEAGARDEKHGHRARDVPAQDRAALRLVGGMHRRSGPQT